MSEFPELVVELVAAAIWADAYKRPFDEFARASETVRAAYFSIVRIGLAKFLELLEERAGAPLLIYTRKGDLPGPVVTLAELLESPNAD